MSRTPADARRWMDLGHRLVREAIAGLDEGELSAATLLPDWTRRHLVAHVAANAEALGNLVTWAATGVETPMYASPGDRAASIERGAGLPREELVAWERRATTALTEGLERLDGESWSSEVRTVQGRALPATEIPWLRAREVLVHAVDLDLGLGFRDLPPDFLAALVDDIVTKRGEVPLVDGPLPEVAAWLAGRPHTLTDAPDLGPWL